MRHHPLIQTHHLKQQSLHQDELWIVLPCCLSKSISELLCLNKNKYIATKRRLTIWLLLCSSLCFCSVPVVFTASSFSFECDCQLETTDTMSGRICGSKRINIHCEIIKPFHSLFSHHPHLAQCLSVKLHKRLHHGRAVNV